jgi:1-acyl-sn-glycerol-3-phosphate acyltransferase
MLGKLRSLYCIAVSVLALAILFPVACLAMILTWQPAASIWVARRLWAPILLRAGGAKLVVEGQENVDRWRSTVYASNHQSTIDVPVLFVALPVNLRFIAKSQLRWVPLLGWYLWLAGHIFVDRGKTRRAIASLDRAVRQIRSGVSLIVFVEGTRSANGRILPFKKGPFALAIKAKVPICPVTVEGSGKLMPKNSWKITPGEIRVKIGPPIETGHLQEGDREKLMCTVRDLIIGQSLELGGRGGDRGVGLGAKGVEGVGSTPTPEER